jgi:RNA polymerase sigma factor (sigma-70 family)
VAQPPSESVTCAPAYEAQPAEQSRWFADQIQAHESQLKSYLHGSFPTIRDVDDVVQESYFRVWRRQLARPIKSAKAFLFQVARHLAIDSLRHERASPFADVMDLARLYVIEDRPGVVEAVCTNEEIDLLHAAIDTLPARCREIVVLRKLHGLSQKEIARTLGISESTVQVQASRGLRRCASFVRAQLTKGPAKT